MSALLPYLVNWLQEFGYPLLWITVYIASVGIPLPITLVLLAAGAFAVLGDFNIFVLLVIALSASCAGDSTGYLLGRRWGSRVLNWLATSGQHLISPRVIERSQKFFQRRGGWAVFLSRSIFSALGGVINLLAGAEFYAYRRFILADLAGEALGTSLPLILGFVFGASWEAIGDIIGTTSSFLLALLLAVWLAYYLFTLLRRYRKSRLKRATESDYLVLTNEKTQNSVDSSSSLPL